MNTFSFLVRNILAQHDKWVRKIGLLFYGVYRLTFNNIGIEV